MTQVDQLTNLGYELTADGKSVHCQWQGNGSPPECARDLLSELKAQKGAALEYLLKIPNCEISPSDFVVWAEADAHRISNIKDGDKREVALLAFESRCAQFDTLPDSTKQQALSMSIPKESVVASPFDDGCTGADWPVVIADLGNPGQYVARYSGTLTPAGRGENEYEALENLRNQKGGCQD